MSGVKMETYLRRTYAQKNTSTPKEDFPFWDYRSRRGAFSCSNSSFSSSNSSCDGSSISSVSSRSENGSENISISDQSDTDSLLACDQQKLTLQFLTDTHEICAMEELFQPIINWIDPDLHILKITDKSECLNNEFSSLPDISARIPSMAIMLFLQESGMVGFERIQSVKRYFEKNQWKFHHSEQVNRGAINPYPYNSQDFYYTSEDLPLWAVRQVHTGKEFIRTVLFVGESNWQSMMQFYKLVLGCEPDMKREDFCLFTVNSYPNFDVQLALKKLKGDTKPRVLESVKIQFRVSDLSNIVPLLPNICRPLSDTKWETTDNDGNVVVLEMPRTGSQANSSFSDRCSLSDRSSLSDRNSIADRNSVRSSLADRNGYCQRRVRSNSNTNNQFKGMNEESQNRGEAPRCQRTKSLIGDETLLQKIKINNMIYQKNSINAIKEKHANIQKNLGDYYQSVATDKENNQIEDPEKTLKALKSFYV